jgi:prephenate dehydrogenase
VDSTAARSLRPLDQWSQVTIVGLGLIGGSFARALRVHFPALRLVGVDRAEALDAHWVPELVDEALGADSEPRVRQAFASSDLVFLATPVDSIQHWLGAALASGALVSDCGSTKRAIVRAAQASSAVGRFVPGHPMAGVSGGLKQASATLFEQQAWVLCPDGVEPVAFERIETLVRRFGARPIRMSPAEHDRAVAATSHAARLLASALLVVSDRRDAFAAAGPAIERLSRVAGGASAVWSDILASNPDEIASALEEVMALLRRCADELASSGTTRHSLELLSLADDARERLDASRRGGSNG